MVDDDDANTAACTACEWLYERTVVVQHHQLGGARLDWTCSEQQPAFIMFNVNTLIPLKEPPGM